VISFTEIREKLIRLCQREIAIQAVYIFGSVSLQEDKEPGDIDIAILVEEDQLPSFSVPSFISLLERTLRYPVDLVVLNRAGEVLKYEVRRTGKLIFERSPDIGKRFEISSRKYYEDFLFLHKRYVNNVLYGGRNGQ
jgi:predicted nucleotidyltransferase